MMNNIRKFLSLETSYRLLLINAYFALIGTILLLKIFPYNQLRQFIANQSKKKKHFTNDSVTANRIVAAVKTASQYAPGNSTCLIKALTGYYLLTQKNIPAEMYIGVKLGLPGQLNAHAWVVNQGEVLLGYLDDLPSYTKLTPQSMNAV